MSDVAASDFRLPHRYVRLDTILRLRWLAALGQLTAIFIVAHGLEFDFPIVGCVAIVGVSALLNLALQIAFNPMQRLEPVYAEVRVPRYRRVFTLSRELDPGRIEANLKDGVLNLRIPKQEHAQPRRIQVQVG